MSNDLNERVAILETEAKLMRDYFREEGIRLHGLLERHIIDTRDSRIESQKQIRDLAKTVNKIIWVASIISAVMLSSKIGLMDAIKLFIGVV